MNRFIALAALTLASTAAQAGDSYSFDIGGKTIRIDKPRDCDDASCISISIPGVLEAGPKHKRSTIDRDDAVDDKPAQDRVQETRKPLGPPPSTGDTTANRQSVEPANGTPPAAAPAPAPDATTTTASRTPASEAAPAATPAPAAQPPAAATPEKPPVVATAPATQSLPDQTPVASAAPSPLGVWLTEEKEGKVRIEPCGGNLCGYSVNAKTNENGEKVLINMKPGDNKWSGRIHDPKSGSNYDSTIALKGPDRLRVQGCAFGGMFCGGQTWTRVN